MSLSSYLLVMSWVAYGVIGMGVGRSGFEALAMKDSSGVNHGIDLFKILTLGLYNLDQELTLNRVVYISIGCCIILLIILVNFV